MELHHTTIANASTSEGLGEEIVEAIKTVYDPEIPVNVYDLGLIYAIDIDAERRVHIRMTLTAPGCPAAGILPDQVATAAGSVEGVEDVDVQLVFDPPYHRDMMSEEAKLELGFL